MCRKVLLLQRQTPIATLSLSIPTSSVRLCRLFRRPFSFSLHSLWYGKFISSTRFDSHSLRFSVHITTSAYRYRCSLFDLVKNFAFLRSRPAPTASFCTRIVFLPFVASNSLLFHFHFRFHSIVATFRLFRCSISRQI